MKFTNILLLSIILGGGYTYFFEKREQPTFNENLITQFDKRDVVKRNEWKKGDVIDGIQAYSARKDYSMLQSVWGLGVKNTSVTAFTTGVMPQVERQAVLEQCVQLAKIVLNSDDDSIVNAVSTIFSAATKAYQEAGKKVRASGDIGLTPFSVQVQNIAPVLTYSCVADRT